MKRRYTQYTVLFIFIVALLATLSAWQVSSHAAGRRDKDKEAIIVTYPTDLNLIDVGTVTQVQKSNLIQLKNGKSYRINAIRIPVYYDPSAVEYLKQHVLGKKVGIYAHTKKREDITDKFGNTEGHVVREDGTWIQGDMVARGLAWAYSTADNRFLARALQKYEHAARALKSGFWNDPEYAIKHKKNIGKYLNSYQLYEGLLMYLDKDRSMNGNYNFFCDTAQGSDKHPMSFMIPIDSMSIFTPRDTPYFSPQNWLRSRVRVRGWVEEKNGIPTIMVTHPEQMEFLSPDKLDILNPATLKAGEE